MVVSRRASQGEPQGATGTEYDIGFQSFQSAKNRNLTLQRAQSHQKLDVAFSNLYLV